MSERSYIQHGRRHGPNGSDPIPVPVFNFVGARIQATSTQTVTTSTNTDFSYQEILFDTDNMVDLDGDDRILTVNTEGIYIVVCQTIWAFNATGRRINVAIHNDYYSSGSPIPAVDSQSDNRNAITTGSGRTSNTSVAIYQASVGDFFSSGGYQASGGDLDANGFANCFLSAAHIGG